MALFGVLCHAKDGALGRVDPVRSEEPTERCDEHDAAVVRNRLGNLFDLVGLVEEAQVVDEELDARAGDSDAAFKSVDGFAARAKVVGDCGKKAMG